MTSRRLRLGAIAMLLVANAGCGGGDSGGEPSSDTGVQDDTHAQLDSITDAHGDVASDAHVDAFDAETETGPTKSQLADLQGDLMLWVPDLKPDCTTGEDPVTHIRCVSDTGQIPNGILAGWVWSVTVGRYPKDAREKIYQAAIAAGYTHFALHVGSCVPGGFYHGLYPTTDADCATAGDVMNTVLHEIIDHHLIPYCAGVSPVDPPLAGMDRSLCPVAMTDWDNSDQADCRIKAVAEAFPSALVYYELPEGAITPKPDTCSPSPFPATGADWVAQAKAKYPNFMGVFYEINQPDGVDANVAELTKAHVFWSSAQEVLGETDTYWKFWDNLDVNAEKTYNDTLLARASWLHGFFSGGTTHKP
jgi:hypothetical protein